MANLRGILVAESGTGRTSEVSRRASAYIRAYLNTWHTELAVSLGTDGKVFIDVKRDGIRIYSHAIEAEGSAYPDEEIRTEG